MLKEAMDQQKKISALVAMVVDSDQFLNIQYCRAMYHQRLNIIFKNKYKRCVY
jgi:hypothetical protein